MGWTTKKRIHCWFLFHLTIILFNHTLGEQLIPVKISLNVTNERTNERTNKQTCSISQYLPPLLCLQKQSKPSGSTPVSWQIPKPEASSHLTIPPNSAFPALSLSQKLIWDFINQDNVSQSPESLIWDSVSQYIIINMVVWVDWYSYYNSCDHWTGCSEQEQSNSL